MNSLHDIPGNHQAICAVIAHLAATATENHCVFRAPFPLSVVGIGFTCGTAVSGADTNTTHLNFDDRGADGTSTAEVGTYDLTSGNDLVACAEQDITITAFAMAEGDTLSLEHEKIGNGLLVPTGLVRVTFQAA